MSDDDIVDIQKLSVSPGNVVVITVKDDLADDGLGTISQILNQFSNDSGAMVLVFRERVVSDFKTLGLVELVKLQEVIEKAILELTTRDSKGEA